MIDVEGVAVAIVDNAEQEGGQGRVFVKFPWDPKNPGIWARVTAPLGGPSRGFWFMPEQDDEVLVAFDRGDRAHAYVVGSLWNGVDTTPETDPKLRVLVTPGGHELRFEDVDEAKQIVLKTQGNQRLVLRDNAEGTKIELSTDGGVQLTLDEGSGNVLLAKAAGGQQLLIDDTKAELSAGGRKITLAGGQVKFE